MLRRKTKMATVFKEDYVFNNVDTLVNYLFQEYGELTPLKLQKGLYFLYSYYGALFNESQEEGSLEEDFNMPGELFPADFEAWTYGPVIRSVYHSYKEGNYGSDAVVSEEVEEITEEYPKAIHFIKDMFTQVNSLSDFTLVDRSHEDEAWKNAYSKGKSTGIDNYELIKEYKEKYV